MNLSDWPVELDPVIRKRFQETQICKERFLFMALCSDDDRELLFSDKEMDVKDFDRLQCLMTNLGLENLHSYFLMEHPELMSLLGNQLEDEDTIDEDIDIKMREMAQWQQAFLAQLPSDKMRYFISKVLSV